MPKQVLNAEEPHNTSPRLLEPDLLGTWMAERLDIWQMRLLSARDLAHFARDRGVKFWPDHIVQLWQLCLLWADLVISNWKLRQVGLVDVGMDDLGQHLYADERQLRPRVKGWGSAAAKLRPLPTGVQLFFHPFRYYVLYHLNRVLELDVHPMQMLAAIERYPKMLDFSLSSFQQWSGSRDFLQAVERWNDITALAVVTEPCTYTRLFGTFTRPAFLDEETQRKRIADHWVEVAKCYERAGLRRVEEARQDLCEDAELLDPNKDVHTMLRLMEGKSRLELKGRLGGAILLRTMAETLRRAAEKVWSTTLPEEDELGFGGMLLDVKKEIYGSNRLLDGKRSVASEFMRQFGLDYGTRLRWYVEGDTEWSALYSIFERYSRAGIEVINLRGQVVQKHVLAFRDNLRADIRAGMFSFVSVDGDMSEYLRAVRKAAEDDEICGMFFVSKPDFEFGNFALSELEEILWEIAIEHRAHQNGRLRLRHAIANAKSGKELLFVAVRALPVLNHVTKGEQWGEHLIQYALRHRERPDGTLRPIVDAVEMAFRSAYISYHPTRSRFRVDPETGKLVERGPNKVQAI